MKVKIFRAGKRGNRSYHCFSQRCKKTGVEHFPWSSNQKTIIEHLRKNRNAERSLAKAKKLLQEPPSLVCPSNVSMFSSFHPNHHIHKQSCTGHFGARHHTWTFKKKSSRLILIALWSRLLAPFYRWRSQSLSKCQSEHSNQFCQIPSLPPPRP